MVIRNPQLKEAADKALAQMELDGWDVDRGRRVTGCRLASARDCLYSCVNQRELDFHINLFQEHIRAKKARVLRKSS
jgi:hypothetical protein